MIQEYYQHIFLSPEIKNINQIIGFDLLSQKNINLHDLPLCLFELKLERHHRIPPENDIKLKLLNCKYLYKKVFQKECSKVLMCLNGNSEM